MDDVIPDWLTPGATVLVITYSTGTQTARTATVEKLNKASVVVGGDRYALRDLTHRWGGSYGPHATLYAPNDPDALAVRAEGRRKAAAMRVEITAGKWRNDPNPATLDAMRTAIARLSAILPTEKD